MKKSFLLIDYLNNSVANEYLIICVVCGVWCVSCGMLKLNSTNSRPTRSTNKRFQLIQLAIIHTNSEELFDRTFDLFK